MAEFRTLEACLDATAAQSCGRKDDAEWTLVGEIDVQADNPVIIPEQTRI
ncbi:hypothetical protein [Amycolatopsis sp. NPDC054798]